MICPNCGKEVEDHEKVCKYCSEVFGRNIDKKGIQSKVTCFSALGILGALGAVGALFFLIVSGMIIIDIFLMIFGVNGEEWLTTRFFNSLGGLKWIGLFATSGFAEIFSIIFGIFN